MSWFHFHHIKKLFDVGACFGKAQTHFIYVLISHTHTHTHRHIHNKMKICMWIGVHTIKKLKNNSKCRKNIGVHLSSMKPDIKDIAKI